MRYQDYELSLDDLRNFYYHLYLCRYTDEEMIRMYKQGLLAELPHSSQGEEAVAVGAGYALRPQDYVLPSLRARGLFFLKGISSRIMMAGAFGKDTGPYHGKNTSHHMGDMALGVVCGTGSIGSSMPLAVGIGLGLKKDKKGSVVLVSFGDGSTSQGDFHESLNMAAVMNLPVIFLCENNSIAMGTDIAQQMKNPNIAQRAAGYAIPGICVDGNDVLAVYAATRAAVERAAAGDGPTLIECKTDRWGGHSAKDANICRSEEVLAGYLENCPVKRYKEFLLQEKYFDAAGIAQIEQDVVAEVSDAIEYAEQSVFPAPELVSTHVYIG